MKVFIKNSITKKFLIIIITLIMVSNFIMPNYVCAGVGTDVVNGLFHLIAFVGDIGLKTMQKLMIGDGNIKVGDEYVIKYSPGTIFSNAVPSLDINFLDPKGDEEADEVSKEATYDLVLNIDIAGTKAGRVIDIEKFIEDCYNKTFNTNNILDLEKLSKTTMPTWFNVVDAGEYNNGQSFYFKENYTEYLVFTNTIDSQVINGEAWNDYNIRIYAAGKNQVNKWQVADAYYESYQYPGATEITDNTVTESATVKSSSKVLQPYIKKWYNSLRKLALVGLLSVLLYIGIKIVLSSSSANDKAKYKNMLKDWLIAICILYMLHFIMAFMLQSVGVLNGLISNNNSSISGLQKDELMSEIRSKVNDPAEAGSESNAGYTIMYLALVILTGVFTFQYLKRVIYMAFLTMIAPMIAFTYPLDKIRDGKAQAFNFWLKEYMFNCLIQPIHLLLYTIFVSNAIEIAKANTLYAIVALAFMVPAEKIIKEMFGIKSNGPTNTLGAAAGGAFVMNMLNKMKAKQSKASSSSSGSKPSGVRTATRNNSGDSARTASNNNNDQAPLDSGNDAQESGGSGAVRQNASSQSSGNPDSNNLNLSDTNATVSNNFGGTKKKSIKGLDKVKPYGKTFGRTLGGAALGLAAGTAALAAQVADGDLINKPSEIGKVLGGVGLGYAAGKGLVDRGFNGVESISDKIKRSNLTLEEYNNQKFDKEFYKSDGYKMIEQDDGLISQYGEEGIKEATQQFLDNGITDATQIRNAMKNGISGDEYKAYSSAGVTDPKEITKARAKFGSAEKYNDFKKISKLARQAKVESFEDFRDTVGGIRLNSGEVLISEIDTMRIMWDAMNSTSFMD